MARRGYWHATVQTSLGNFAVLFDDHGDWLFERSGGPRCITPKRRRALADHGVSLSAHPTGFWAETADWAESWVCEAFPRPTDSYDAPMGKTLNDALLNAYRQLLETAVSVALSKMPQYPGYSGEAEQ